MSSSIVSRLARLPPPPQMRPTMPRSALRALIEPRETPAGPLYLVQYRDGASLPPGAPALQSLALSSQAFDVSRPLFFDTETTGLAGGTGTLPFLVGTAEIREEQCVVSQVHLSAPGEERPMLTWLAERLEAASLWVSFNGKSFDWPLLRTRFVMNRISPPREKPHLDLLHCARRVFRHRLKDVRLGSLEREVLGIQRQGDIDGALIPAAWFDYLRTGRVAVLSRVMQHNAQDVRSMVDLVNHLVALWNEQLPMHPEVALGLASVAQRAGDEARALRFVGHATTGAKAAAAWSLAAEMRRRRREYQAAVEALHQALPGHDDAPLVHLRLSKLYEHRLRDYAAALRHAQLGRAAEVPQRHLQRTARLERRCMA